MHSEEPVHSERPLPQPKSEPRFRLQGYPNHTHTHTHSHISSPCWRTPTTAPATDWPIREAEPAVRNQSSGCVYFMRSALILFDLCVFNIRWLLLSSASTRVFYILICSPPVCLFNGGEASLCECVKPNPPVNRNTNRNEWPRPFIWPWIRFRHPNRHTPSCSFLFD